MLVSRFRLCAFVFSVALAFLPEGFAGTTRPAIVTQPVPVSVRENAPASFSVTASGGYLRYQWKKNETPIPGATLPTYSIPAVSRFDLGNYTVTVSNPMGSVSSAQASLTLAPAYQQPSASICDTAQAVSGGFLCAIRPSRLDPAARDVYGAASLSDARLGFGHHAILFPSTDRKVTGVYLHFTGSYGRPYDPATGAFPNASFHAENVNSGHVIIQLAYDNRFEVNEDLCSQHLSVDNCAGLVRQEKLTGADVSPVSHTPYADSIETRIRRLSDYLAARGVRLPVPLVLNGQINWKSLRLGGHSQGSGHAYFIAKRTQVAHACLLGGPFDSPDAAGGIRRIADWMLVPGSATAVSSIEAAASRDDEHYAQFRFAYEVMGLQYGSSWFDVDALYYTDGAGKVIDAHAGIMKDPRFASLRTQLCFF